VGGGGGGCGGVWGWGGGGVLSRRIPGTKKNICTIPNILWTRGYNHAENKVNALKIQGGPNAMNAGFPTTPGSSRGQRSAVPGGKTEMLVLTNDSEKVKVTQELRGGKGNSIEGRFQTLEILLSNETLVFCETVDTSGRNRLVAYVAYVTDEDMRFEITSVVPKCFGQKWGCKKSLGPTTYRVGGQGGYP